MRILALAAVIALGLTAPAMAWGPNGHRIVAKLGEDNMDPAARTAMQMLTGSRSLDLLSTWPDFVRSVGAYDCFKPWHHLTAEDDQPVADALTTKPEIRGKCVEADFERLAMPKNVVEAIDYFAAVLTGDTDKTDDFTELLSLGGADPLHGSVQLTALALLVHLVGDVHQPLHVGRKADQGGNWVFVRWFDEPKDKRLHEVWDELLIERQLLSYSEFAAFLEQDFADQPTVGFGDGPVTWAQESADHRPAVYDFGETPDGEKPKLSYDYSDAQDALLKQRLYQGGMRLAEQLNGIFAP